MRTIQLIVRMALTLAAVIFVVFSSWETARWMVGLFLLFDAVAHELSAHLADIVIKAVKELKDAR